MNLLYIGYWGANEGLSKASIHPHLEILAEFDVEKIIYVSLERSGDKEFNLPKLEKLIHIPIYTNRYSIRFFDKFYDFLKLPYDLHKIAQKYSCKYLICRSSLAGYYGNWINKRMDIPYSVESFEPHTDYMIESGVWSKKGISAYFGRRWEKQQFSSSEYLITVTHNYRNDLIKQGIAPAKLLVAPCAIEPNRFKFNQQDRNSIRRALGISENAVVGIYVGKFGGIYHSILEASKIFKQAFKEFSNFHLIILSPQDSNDLIEALTNDSLIPERLSVLSVGHSEVPKYLSSADFAFSLHLPSKSMKYVSPIKNGEYWSNGLPILIPNGIGDDHIRISNNLKYGAVFNEANENYLRKAFSRIKKAMTLNPGRFDLNDEERYFSNVRNVYMQILGM